MKPTPSQDSRSAHASKVIRGLYAITPEEPDTARLCALLARALSGGAAIVQYRNKLLAAPQRRAQAQEVLELCRQHRAPLIINDDVDLACAIEADGVHLGRTDGDLAQARARLGAGKLLGASCYDRFELAQLAVAQGADHVAFGSMFASSTKPGNVRAPLALFSRVRNELGVPCVAIGGITPENAPEVIAAGADALAVISALFDAADITAQARRFRQLFPVPT